MEFGDTGEHGQAAARAALAAKRFVSDNVINQLQIMAEKIVLEWNKTMVLAISSHARVTKIFCLLVWPQNLDITYSYRFELGPENIFQSSAFSVHGNWGLWGAWTTCSKTCGVAEKTRSRICNNPANAHGGETCDGSSQEKNTCKETNCPGENIAVYLSMRPKFWRITNT